MAFQGVFVLILLWAVLLPALGLSVGEKAALGVLKANFDGLGSVAALDEYPSVDGVHYGGSWTKPFEEVCSNGAGWDVHGILCNEGGAIIGIRFTNSWGKLTNALPSITLPYLKQVYDLPSVIESLES